MKSHLRLPILLLSLCLLPFGIAAYQDAHASEGEFVPYWAEMLFDDGSDPMAGYSQQRERERMEEFEYGFDDIDSDEIDALLAELRADDFYNDGDSSYEDYLDETEEGPDHMDQAFFDDLFFAGGESKVPVLSGALSGISIGMSEEALLKLHPDYDEWYQGTLAYEHLETSKEFDQYDKVESILFTFPDDGTAQRSFTAQLGQGQSIGQIYKDPSLVWLNPQTQQSFTLSEADYDEGLRSIEVNAYRSIDSVIPKKGLLMGFEYKDYLSMSPRELEKHLDEDGEIERSLAFVPELGATVDLTAYTDYAGKLRYFQFGMQLDDEAYELLMSRLTTKYGKAKSLNDDWSEAKSFTKKKRAVQVERDDGWTVVSVGRKGELDTDTDDY